MIAASSSYPSISAVSADGLTFGTRAMSINSSTFKLAFFHFTLQTKQFNYVSIRTQTVALAPNGSKRIPGYHLRSAKCNQNGAKQFL
jgi:hypothetical protein